MKRALNSFCESLAIVLVMCAAGLASATDAQVTVDGRKAGEPGISIYRNTASTSPEVHIIGIHHAQNKSSATDIGTVIVNVSGSTNVPVNLVLSAYESTQWKLEGSGVPFIKTVLINGYYIGTVSGLDPGSVINKTWENFLGATGHEWPAGHVGTDTARLVQKLEKIFNAPIASFAGAYQPSRIDLVLVPSNAPIPAAKTTPSGRLPPWQLGLLSLVALGLLYIVYRRFKHR